MLKLRGRVFHVLEVEEGDTGFERFVNLALASLVLVNIAAVVLETVSELQARFDTTFVAIETISVAVFAVEYVLRVWSCVENPAFAGPGGRLRYVLTPLALVDLVSILPSLVPGGTLDLRFMRSIRLLRLLRSLKMARYSRSLQTLITVTRAKREELGIAALLGVVLLVCAAGGIYYAERDAQPDRFPSIPAAMWWAVVTLTTVGYGDVYPVTAAGKVLASVVAALGIGLFALPAGILASGFSEAVRDEHRDSKRCPHCGGAIEP